MEKETGFTDAFLETSEWYGSDRVDHMNEDGSKNDDDSSDNESWSSYENLPEEDFQKKEDGACSENVSDVYIDIVGRRTIWVLTCAYDFLCAGGY
jgi:hypothetical protein